MKGLAASQPIRSRAKSIALMCTLVYFASYVMRINFAAIMVKVGAQMDIAKTELAVVVTCLTVAYGAGQILSGIMGDRIRPAYMLSAGLILAVICNVAMFFCNSIPAMSVVWCVNGFAHSLLWPPIVRIMSTYLRGDEYSYCAVRVSWGSSAATILVYLGAPLLLLVTSWRGVMLACALIGAVIAVSWLLVSPRILIEPVVADADSSAVQKRKSAPALPAFVYLPVALIMCAIILQGILRDGVTNWMPSYLLETFGLDEEMAIVATVILALFSVLSFWVFDLIHRKLFKNEVVCSAVIYAVSALSALLLYVFNKANAGVAVSMILMAVIVACMHGINLMLITVVPRRFIKSGRVATYSGILNSCTYVGASIATYAFAAAAESFGWGFTIFTWIAVSVLGLLVCLICAPLWRRFRRVYSDNPDVK